MFAWDDTFSPAGDDVLGAPIDALNAAIGACQRELLRQVAEMPVDNDWERWGARDDAHWLSMRMGTSYWKAERLIRAAQALEGLPRLCEALGSGRLHLDKVLELARFATASEEAKLIAWADTKPPVAIRQEGERRTRRLAEEVLEVERTRSVNWWYQEGQFNLEASLPAAQGATVAKALGRLAEKLPVMPGEEGVTCIEQRRADALVALCAGRLSADPDPDRATVVVHARLEDLRKDGAGAQIEGGGVMDPLSVSRLLCDARVQTVLEDETGGLIGVSAMRREPPAWLVRLVRQRDTTCRFPGCDARQFTQVHHIEFWSKGGRTTYENSLLLCWLHHRLVHEYGWAVRRSADGMVTWFWPDGTPHRHGRSPDGEERRELGRRLEVTRERYGLKPSDLPFEMRVTPGVRTLRPGSSNRPVTSRVAPQLAHVRSPVLAVHSASQPP